MSEDHIPVLLVLELVFLKLISSRKVDTPQFELEEKGNFVTWKSDVNFDRKSNALVTIDLFKERFLTSFEPDLSKLVCLDNDVELILLEVDTNYARG